MKEIKFTAFGIPQPKGSTKSFVVNGRAVTTSDNKKLKPWHTVVAYAAQEHRPKDGLLQGAVAVDLVFCLIRPKSVSVKKRPFPTTKPDVDKLARGVCDALKGTIYADDSQVVDIRASKIYSDTPRVDVIVREVEPCQDTHT
jgi:Holliday junction resolvase RusA-like endonuclease